MSHVVSRRVRVAQSLSDMRHLVGHTGDVMVLDGETEPGDGAWGLFRWDASITNTGQDDGVSIVVPNLYPNGRARTPVGAWRRIDPGHAHGTFATTNPSIDGLAAPVGTIWIATDCPVRFLKVGTADTDWQVMGIGTECALAMCATWDDPQAAAQALFRGAAREMAADDYSGLAFLLDHLWTPDSVGNRMFDSIGGKHLTHHGDADEARVARGPLGWQIEQLDNTTSYFASDDNNVGKVAAAAFALPAVGSCTKPSGGGNVISKISHGSPDEKGWGWAFDPDLPSWVMYGDGPPDPAHWDGLPPTHRDDPTGPLPEVEDQHLCDGFVRYIDFGRSVTDAYGYNGIDGWENYYDGGVSQPDPPGDLDANVPFGFVHTNAGPLYHSYGDCQWMALGLMKGASGENYATHRDAIRRFFQTQLGNARQAYRKPEPFGYRLREELVDPVNLNAIHLFNNTRRPVQITASFQITIGGGGGTATIEIQKDMDPAMGSPDTVAFIEISSPGSFSDTRTVTFWVLPLQYVKFKKTEVGSVFFTDPVEPILKTTPIP